MINIIKGDTCVGIKIGKNQELLNLTELRDLLCKLQDACISLELKQKCQCGSNKDEWIPAGGGSETPFISFGGKRVLYCWNPSRQKHAYLDLDTDTILTDEEANQTLGFFD